MSPILVLFYNADLVDLCNTLELPISSIGFVDDVNFLAFGKSTEATCTTRKKIHSCCLRWGEMHGVLFAPEKYALVHFSKKEMNISTTPLTLPTTLLIPSPHTRVLDLILNSRLSWHPHNLFIKSNLRIQIFAVTRLIFHTWEASFKSCRLLYTSIVRPAITNVLSV